MSIRFSDKDARIVPFPILSAPTSDSRLAGASTKSSRLKHADAEIIPFPASAWFASRLTPKERAEISKWEESLTAFGFIQVTTCDSGPSSDPSTGELILVYYKGELWLLETIGRAGRRFALRRRTSQSKCREFGTITEALNAILDESAAA